MASLVGFLKRKRDELVDVVSPNTKADQARRTAQGRPAQYQGPSFANRAVDIANPIDDVLQGAGAVLRATSRAIPTAPITNPVGRGVNSFLVNPLKQTGGNVGQILGGDNPYKGSVGQQAGQALEDALTLGSAVPIGRAAQATARIPQLIKSGAKVGAGFGGAQGLSQSLQDKANLPQTLKQTAAGAGIGSLAGGVLGGALPAVGAGVRKLKPTTLPRPVAPPKAPPTPIERPKIPAGQGSAQKPNMPELPLKLRSQGSKLNPEQRAIQQIAEREGISVAEAEPIYQQILKESVAPNQTLSVAEDLRSIVKPKKDAEFKSVMKRIGNTRNAAASEASLTANIIRQEARKQGVDIGEDFINRYQTGQLKPNERELGDVIKRETDRIFNQQKAIDPTIQYRKNYVPQVYKQPEQEIEAAVRQLQTKTGSAIPRKFNTYEEARGFGLTPKHSTLDKILGENASSARRAIGNQKAVSEGLDKGIFTTEGKKGLSPVLGFYDQGAPIYAKKNVADVINGALQESETGISNLVKKSAAVNGVWQDIALSGGVPFTPINAFVINQAFKDIVSGRASIAKDMVYSLSKNATQKRFAQNADFVRKMADRGVRFNVQSDLGNQAGITKGIWAKAINEPTFQRFMPNQYLTVAENVYKKASKKLPEKEALNLAAETTKKFYGIVDPVSIGRDTNTQNVIGSLFFAPRYRESVLNSLFNSVKSADPRTWSDPSYAMNRRLLTGMAVTLFGYDQLNRQINGHSMFDNRKGQELSVQIPYGSKNAKGDQPVVNIPFMPGFATIPRSAFNAVKATLDGSITSTDPNKGSAITEAGKLLSMPIQTGTQILGNRDYFTNPIYINKEAAEREGVDPDSPLAALGKVGAYLAKQSTPSYVRAGISKAQGKPNEQVAAQAAEVPRKVRKGYKPRYYGLF